MIKRVHVGAVIVLIGCTTTGRIDSKTPITTDMAQYQSISVDVAHRINRIKELQLEERLVKRLESSGRFRSVSARSANPNAKSDLTLLVSVLEFPRGGIWRRSLFGRSAASLHIKLIDEATSQVIGESRTVGEASVGALWTSTANRALKRAEEKAVEFVVSD